ncbi:major facilitator superfamily domain-containing protein [Cladochytrium replicatum]|nr:major facilitator superfamily domain-containing protein [Cladochytrium replicatum]
MVQPTTQNFPIRSVFIVLSTIFPEILVHHMLGPLYPYMARTLAQSEDQVGTYTGLLASAYHLPTVVMNLAWGGLSDRLGRKPILLAGLMGFSIGCTCLGLSTVFWFSFVSLLVAGTFTGNSVVAKGYIGQIAPDESTLAFGYTAYGLTHGVAAIVGSSFGGLLADPIITKDSPFLQKHPYFLVCMVGASLAVTIAIGATLFLKNVPPTWKNSSSGGHGQHGYESVAVKEVDEAVGMASDHETSHGIHKRTMAGDDEDDDRIDANAEKAWRESSPSPSPGRSVGSLPEPSKLDHRALEEDDSEERTHSLSPTYPVLISLVQSYIPARLRLFYRAHIAPYTTVLTAKSIHIIALYSLFAFADSTFNTAMPLLAASPPDKGGLAMTPKSTALAVTCGNLAKLVTKAVFYLLQKHFGTMGCYRLGVSFIMLAALTLALLRAGAGDGSAVWHLVAAAVFAGIGSGISYLSVILALTESVSSEHLGLMHGLAGTTASVVRTVGPIVSGGLWQAGVGAHAPGMVFVFCLLIEVGALLATRGFGVGTS